VSARRKLVQGLCAPEEGGFLEGIERSRGRNLTHHSAPIEGAGVRDSAAAAGTAFICRKTNACGRSKIAKLPIYWGPLVIITHYSPFLERIHGV